MLDKSRVDHIPVLDFSIFVDGNQTEKEVFASELRWIQEKIGFYYLVNHGIDGDLIGAAIRQIEELHSLPIKEKLKLKVDENATGYVPINSTIYVTTDIAQNDKPDLNENYRIVRDRDPDHPSILAGRRYTGPNKWPNSKLLPNFKNTMLKFFSAMEGLGYSLLPLYAQALGLNPEHFNNYFTDPMWFTRNVHYPAVKAQRNQFGIAPHSDHGFITLLPVSKVPGLEVKTQEGSWISGEYVENAICINSGDFMKKWTNGRFIATPHRVLPPKQERYISAFFFNPNWDVLSAPLPGCLDEQNPLKFEITTFYNHLCNYIDRNYSVSSGGKALDSKL